MTASFSTLSEPTIRKLADDHTRLVHEVLNLRRLLTYKARTPPAKPARVRFTNGSGEDIPAYAVMAVTDCDTTRGVPVYVVGKPSTTFYPRYLVNGGRKALVGLGGSSGDGGGYATWLDEGGYVLCDSTYTPALGEEWGPTDGSWALVRHRPGFLIDGGATGSGATYRAVAKQRVVTELIGQPPGDLTKGTAGAVTIFMPKAAESPPFEYADYEDAGYTDLQALPLGSDLSQDLFCSLRFEASGWLVACLES